VTNPIQPVRGMNDVLPADMGAWRHLEQVARAVLDAYGYEQVQVPIIEHTELFKRSIGEFTDIVEKEMYSFQDIGGDSLTLRPEATAGIVRAVISNGLLRGQRHKLWCAGAMFRHERPQQGRYRQFHQIDVEAIGYPGPDVDAELIALSARLWRVLGLERVHLTINSLGTAASRLRYRERLVEYFRAHERALDEDSRRRLLGNPLRILDSKNPQMAALIEAAPLLSEYLDEESQLHFAELRAALDSMSIPYVVNPRLVRGLDYYSRTVFEWITDALGGSLRRPDRSARWRGDAGDWLCARNRARRGTIAPVGQPASGERSGCVPGSERGTRAERGAAPGRATARCPARTWCHAQSGRRQSQDAVSPCRSQRRTAGCDPGR
jgi:histidyl-tRNA synthetase